MERLADLLAGLSRLADLGFGLQSGEALLSSALAAALGRSLDLPDEDIRAGLYTALMLHVGCIGYAHETADLYQDELVMSAASARTNLADPRDVLTTFLPAITRGRPPFDRARLVAAAFFRGQRHAERYTTTACEVGRDATRRLGLDEPVQQSVYHSYEWWNGHGVPSRLVGEDIPAGARLAVLATVAVTFAGTGGTDLAIEAVRRQRGSILDPGFVDHFTANAETLLEHLHTEDPHALVLAAEPRPREWVPDVHLMEVAAVFGDVADLKSPHTHGHSRGVAALARSAGERLGGVDLAQLEMAALLHDVGRVAVSSAIWEKPGPLNTHEWEQVRLHAYHSERILAGSERLASLVPLVGCHHERGDGSGYHRACSHRDLSRPARVLAAADSYQAMRQRRAYRPPLTAEQAEDELQGEARRGRLDTQAVTAVLSAAGHGTTVRRRAAPAGLTDREVEVLGLVAEGCSNKEVGARLVISRRTAEHHVQNVYRKIGVSSRAAAALFAMEHGLLIRRDG